MRLTKRDWLKAAKWHANEAKESAATARRWRRIAAGAKPRPDEVFSCGLLKGWLAPLPMSEHFKWGGR